MVPAYNERDNLAPLLAEIATALTGRSYEVIVVEGFAPRARRSW